MLVPAISKTMQMTNKAPLQVWGFKISLYPQEKTNEECVGDKRCQTIRHNKLRAFDLPHNNISLPSPIKSSDQIQKLSGTTQPFRNLQSALSNKITSDPADKNEDKIII